MSEEKIREIVEDVVQRNVFKSHSALAESVSNLFSNRKKPETIFDRLVHYWPLVIGILFLIVSFVRFGYVDEMAVKAINVVEDRALVLETSVIELQKNQTIFLADMSQVKTDVSWIKNRLK